MVAESNPYAYTDQRPSPIDSFEQSRFWLRLDELSRTAEAKSQREAIDHLKSSVRKVTNLASWISSQVCRFMPQYTLHEERHSLNVLSIMDALVPDGVMAQFGPLDCVLPIMAAFTHDLAQCGVATRTAQPTRMEISPLGVNMIPTERWRQNGKTIRTKTSNRPNQTSTLSPATIRARIDNKCAHPSSRVHGLWIS